MKRLVCTAAVGVLLAAAGPARAGVFELDAQIHSGGMLGVGLFGDAEPFHERARGFSYGALVGVEFLFLDGWIEHNQYYNKDPDTGTGINGTWTQFMIGADVQFDLGERVNAEPNKPKSGFSRGFGELGFGVGFGVATGQQVDPPLDRAQLSDKGFVAQIHLGFGYRITKLLSVGAHFPLQVGYMFLQGEDAAANDLETHYGSFQGAVLVTMRMNFSLTD